MTRRQKRPIAFLTAFAMVLSMLLYLPGSVMTDLGFGIAASAATITPSQPSGDGSEGSPYQIGTAAELYWFAAQVNSGSTTINAVLTADITVNTGVLNASGVLSSTDGFTSWTSIGNKSNQYTGSFNGNDHTISGLFFYNTSTSYVGLFGCIGSGGRVSNVGVVDSGFYGADYVGGISGCNYGTVESCYNAGYVNAPSTPECVGGVCGTNYGTIKNCYNIGKVKLYGVCGYNYYGTLENCYNAGNIMSTSNNSNLKRGLCGSKNGGTITNCYFLNTEVSDVNAIGKTAEEFASGEVAYLLQGKQETAVWGQNIDNGAEKQAYPVLGGAKVYHGYAENDSSTLIYSNSVLNEDTHQHNYNNNNGFCTVCGNYEPAVKNSSGVYEIGNAGQLYWFAQQVNSGNDIKAILTKNITVNEGDVAGCKGTKTEGWKEWTPIGNDSSKYQDTFDGQGYTVSGLYFNNAQANNVGLFGYIGNLGSVSEVGVINSYINGKENVGGVCGYNEGGTITSCYNTVAVSGTKFTGGVCGYNNNYGTIKSCYNTGTVSGTGSYTGGVCGENYGTIENSYNTGAVSSTGHYVGGVCGQNSGRKNIIKNCYNTGAVSGNNHVGGVCGENETGTVVNCYNTGAVSGNEEVGGVCGNIYSGTIANCYFDSMAYSGDAVGVIYGGTVSDNVLGKAAAKFTGGEVAYLLSQGFTVNEVKYDGSVWGQQIGTDPSPVLGGTKVNQVVKYEGCKDAPGEPGTGYSNTDAPIYADHQLFPVYEKPATCTEDGNVAHYKCDFCKKLLADENGGNETTLEAVTIPATGHKLSPIEGKPATCTEDGNIEHYKCDFCKKLFTDENGENETTLEAVTIPAAHKLSHIDANDPTCTKSGNTEHYKCDVCGNLLADENGGNETTLEAVTIPATGHKLSPIEGKPATCTEDGNIEHYKCDVCGNLFADENGENETTLDKVKVTSAGHKFGTAWVSNTQEHYHECTVCHERSDIADHEKDSGTVTKEATLTESGTIEYKCKVCGVKMGEETITATISSFEVTASGVVVKYTVTGSTAVKSQTVKFSEVTEEMVELMKSMDIKHVIDFVNYSTSGSDTVILTAAQMKAIEYVLEYDFGIAS